MSVITDPDRYLAAVVAEFRQDCDELIGYELKRRLWKTAVVVYETTTDPDPWLSELETFAFGGGLRLAAILATFRSAARRVNG